MQEEDTELSKDLTKSAQVLKTCAWVEEEFSLGDFSDKRLFLRLLVLASDLSKNPTAPINQASGSWSMTKAAYRFFDNDKITAESILKGHIRKTKKRISDHTGTVLAIQDTTFLNYSHMKCSQDLGPIGENTSSCMGLVMHTIFAVTAEGLPLGFLHQDIWARDKELGGTLSATRHLKPIEEKESYKWLKAVKEQAALLGNNKKVVAVCDREADIYNLFCLAQQLDIKLLVRASHNRCLDSGEKLWESFSSKPVDFSYQLQVPNTKNDLATLDVKYSPIVVPYPSHKKNLSKVPQSIDSLTALYLHETNPPSHRKPMSWMLLINSPLRSPQEALEVIGWYVKRWKIEVLHKIMKSGCSIELTRLETNKRRLPFVALKSIVAWRLLLITHYNKISPSAPATSILTQSECAALYIIKHNKKIANKTFSTKKAISWLAELGGYLSRKSDPLPGPTHIWRGWHRLQDYTKMLTILS